MSNGSPNRPLPEVACPQCRQRGPWLTTPYGPFCSQRCRLIDLGQWLNETNKISSPLTLDVLEDIENHDVVSPRPEPPASDAE